MFIGLPGLRHMRAKLDWSDPDKFVLDTGRGGCRHTITVDSTGRQVITVEPTGAQLLPQPTRRLGLPPGHTTAGFVGPETRDSFGVGVAAKYATRERLRCTTSYPRAWTSTRGRARRPSSPRTRGGWWP